MTARKTAARRVTAALAAAAVAFSGAVLLAPSASAVDHTTSVLIPSPDPVAVAIGSSSAAVSDFQVRLDGPNEWFDGDVLAFKFTNSVNFISGAGNLSLTLGSTPVSGSNWWITGGELRVRLTSDITTPTSLFFRNLKVDASSAAAVAGPLELQQAEAGSPSVWTANNAVTTLTAGASEVVSITINGATTPVSVTLSPGNTASNATVVAAFNSALSGTQATAYLTGSGGTERVAISASPTPGGTAPTLSIVSDLATGSALGLSATPANGTGGTAAGWATLPTGGVAQLSRATVSGPEVTIAPNTGLNTTYTQIPTVRINASADGAGGIYTLKFVNDSGVSAVNVAGTVRVTPPSGAGDPFDLTIPAGTNAQTVGIEIPLSVLKAGTYRVDGINLSAGLTSGTASGRIKVILESTATSAVPTGGVTATERIVVSTSGSSRIAGVDRYATSAQIAVEFWRNATSTTNNTVIVVNGEEARGGADALAANFLAGSVTAPVVLVTKDSIPSSVLVALDAQARTSVGGSFNTIYVLGDENAVSADVAERLTAFVRFSTDVERIAGATRFETAAQIAAVETAGTFESSTTSGLKRTAFLANGWTPVDALVAGPIAYDGGFPVLLTENGTLSSATAAAIRDRGIQHVIVLGDENAVSESVVTAVEAITQSGVAVTTQRLAGPTRFDTAKEINDLAVKSASSFGFGVTPTNAYLANGWGFADALVAGPLAGVRSGVVVPVNTDALPGTSLEFLTTNRAAVVNVYALGGTNRVADAVLTAATTAAR